MSQNRELRITRVRVIPATGDSPKMIGNNSQLASHGAQTRDPVVLLDTADGLTGIGRLRGCPELHEEEIPRVLGHSAWEFWEEPHGVKLTACEFAIWDLVAKARGVPVYGLLGGKPGAVDVYDGGLYFCDLLFPGLPLERVREEALESVARGFRQIKMKIGRGSKWMEPEAGFRRDVEAVTTVRDAIGPDVLLMVDGNNGFDAPGAIRLFREIGSLQIFWAEEMFPETIEDYRAFKTFLRENGWATLIADGETQGSVEPMLPIMQQGLIEVQQLDINRIGLTEWLRVAQLCRDCGCKLSPHTWSSQIGMFHSLHLGRANPDFLTAEVPAYNVEALLPAGIEWHGGQYHLGPMPGWGLVVNERVYSEKYRDTVRVWEA
jgi:L-alanine-DL-glutamate epimerase-like enolase superfamily enzyme